MQFRDVNMDVDRSLWHVFNAALTTANRLDIPIFNKVDKRDFAKVPTALVFNKLSDLPDTSSTGGTAAKAYAPIANDTLHLNEAKWGQPVKFLYELRVSSTVLDDVRLLEAIIRENTPHQGILNIYDATTDTLAPLEYFNILQTGYANRDDFKEGYYLRVRTLRLEGFAMPASATPVPVLATPVLDVEAEN